MSTRDQGHCLTFVQGHSHLYFQIYSQSAGHIKVKFHVEPGTKVCSKDGGYKVKVTAMPVCGLIFKFFLLRNKKAKMITVT